MLISLGQVFGLRSELGCAWVHQEHLLHRFVDTLSKSNKHPEVVSLVEAAVWIPSWNHTHTENFSPYSCNTWRHHLWAVYFHWQKCRYTRNACVSWDGVKDGVRWDTLMCGATCGTICFSLSHLKKKKFPMETFPYQCFYSVIDRKCLGAG